MAGLLAGDFNKGPGIMSLGCKN